MLSVIIDVIVLYYLIKFTVGEESTPEPVFMWIVLILSSIVIMAIDSLLAPYIGYGTLLVGFGGLYFVVYFIFKLDGKQALQVCGWLYACKIVLLIIMGLISG
jgi:hypothetical protein